VEISNRNKDLEKKLVIFTSGRNWIANILLDAFLVQAVKHYQSDQILIFSTGIYKKSGVILFLIKSIIKFFAFKRKDFEFWIFFKECFRTTSFKIAKKYKIQIITADNFNLNQTKYISLFSKLKADYCFSIVWPFLISRDILDCFKYRYNYHNSLLPSYKGVYSTHWSFYKKENFTGFSFHHITKYLDSGEVVYRNEIPVHKHMSIFQAEWKKTNLAANEMEQIFDKCLNNKNNKIIQSVTRKIENSYFAFKDYYEIVSIFEPQKLSADEIIHRCRCFGYINVMVNGRLIKNIHTVLKIDNKSKINTNRNILKTNCGNYVIFKYDKIKTFIEKLRNNY
jgi:folate-dependent phosphoribosylglycinamide formyltransferase PurN